MSQNFEIKTGIDIVEISRVKKTLERFQNKFLDRIFTPKELSYALNKKFHYSHLAVRFTAKEAVMKALGKSTDFKDIEIQNDSGGVPSAKLYGRALKLASELGVKKISISLSHSKEMAIATAILKIQN